MHFQSITIRAETFSLDTSKAQQVGKLPAAVNGKEGNRAFLLFASVPDVVCLCVKERKKERREEEKLPWIDKLSWEYFQHPEIFFFLGALNLKTPFSTFIFFFP